MIPRHYLDFTLSGADKGAGLPPPIIAGAALKVLHGAFKQQPGRYALALPTGFTALRLFADEREHLDELAEAVEQHPVIRDYTWQGRIRKVPEAFDGAWREYRRYRIPARKSCRKPNDDLRERRMQRADEGRFPYFILNSQSTGQQFGLRVEIIPHLQKSDAQTNDAQPDSYGLSVSSRPFALPDLP